MTGLLNACAECSVFPKLKTSVATDTRHGECGTRGTRYKERLEKHKPYKLQSWVVLVRIWMVLESIQQRGFDEPHQFTLACVWRTCVYRMGMEWGR